jgi:scyllo-inositol 2-dehydrogenase (NADP+)
VRYVVVGLGNIGQRRRALLGARCVATLDPYAPGADYRDPEACPADDYDAVVLAVPNQAKLELLAYFLERGKHVLVEKPLLFPDDATAEALGALAAERGAIWYTSYNHRFEPLIGALKAHLDDDAIGPLYHGRLFYGNGTVGNIVGTWRDAGLGVLEDLGSHLLDLAGYLLGARGTSFVPVALGCHEAAASDHAVLASADGRLLLEMSFLAWKNTFEIDLYGERGSLHLRGLPKWGPSELVRRERVYPSGVPRETRETALGPDRTWERDLEHFEAQVAAGHATLENDSWISSTLRAAAASWAR